MFAFNYRIWPLALIFLSFLAACAPSKKELIPEDILPMSEMAPVLADIHLSEAHIANAGLEGDTAAYVAKSHYVAILTLHEVDYADFTHSMEYYMRQPEFMEQIYERVQEILNVKEGRRFESGKDTTVKKYSNNP